MSLSFELIGPRWTANSPLWVAKVRVTQEPGRRQARLVYGTNVTQGLGPDRKGKLPGTMLVHVQIDHIRVNLGNGTGAFFPAASQVQGSFLVAADPNDWKVGLDVNISRMVCLQGQLPLEPFLGPSLANLPTFFQERLASVFPGGVSRMRASSSGFLFDGRAKMPDQSAALSNLLPIQLEVAKPQLNQPALGDIVFLVDREGLVDPIYQPGQSELLRYFQVMVQDRLNPTLADNKPMMKWLRLELADLSRLPKFHWLLSMAQPQPKLVFADGEWKLYISDQSLAEPQTPTRGVLSSTPTVTIDREQVAIKGSATNRNPTPNGKATYDWSVENPIEKWSLSDVALAYNPIEVSNFLRNIYGLRAPRADDIDLQDIQDGARLTGQVPTSDGRVDPPVLWGFMPVAEGWAQLPFLNCTEQLLVNSLPAYTGGESPKILEVESQFRGAAVFGNDREETYDRDGGPGPWNLTLLDAAEFSGTWKFKPDQSLSSVHLELIDPELTTEGLLELASVAPTPEDAMPSTDDWVGGTFRISLRTPLKSLVQRAGSSVQAENAEVFPSPFLLRFRSLVLEHSETRVQRFPVSQPAFSLAKLAQSEWSYEANEFRHLGTIPTSEMDIQTANPDAPIHLTFPYPVWLMGLQRSRFSASKFWSTDANSPDRAKSALVWRKHPTHPSVHNLPLTQNTLPANHLSASRSLFPFQFRVEKVNGTIPYLRPKSWSFAWEESEQSYRSAGDLFPASDLEGIHRLVVVPLGLPGLAMGLHGFGPVLRELVDQSGYLQRLIIRHDLPLLDQPTALATAPNEDLPSDSPPPPPRALERATYQTHFRKLENRAVLAEVDEAEAVFKTTSGVNVQGLMEPKLWPASLNVQLNQYPGQASLTDLTNANKIDWVGETTNRDALRGFDGTFNVDGDQLRLQSDGHGHVKLIAGSMSAVSARVESQNAIRDQRGLIRQASFANERVVSTPFTQELKGSTRNWTLQTSLNAFNVNVAGSAPWKLWFKGLPMQGEGPFVFSRAETISKARRGINDPAADGRDFGPLNDYQWKLGSTALNHDQPWIPLGPFRFYSLTLERLELNAQGEMVSAAIIGRLQLPCWNGSQGGLPSNREFTEYDSAVVLEIKSGKVSGLSRASADPDPDHQARPQSGCWPLVDSQSPADTPVLMWDELVGESNSGELVAIKLPAGKYRIQYTRQGLVWTTSGIGEVKIPLDVSAFTLPALSFSVPFSASDNAGVKSLTLNLDLKEARHRLKAKWLFRIGAKERLLVEGEWDDEILFAEDSAALVASMIHATRNMNLSVLPSVISLDDFGFSFSWNGFSGNTDPTQVQLLPGFHLATTNACRGFSMVSFRRAAGVETLWPKFELCGAYIDIFFDCIWGKSLQDAVSSHSTLDAKAVFGASSGQIQAEYHSSLALGQNDPWPWELSLSGLLEIKNVVSWPASISVGTSGQVTVPKRDDAPGDHWRHTARLLLSEHKISSVAPLDQNSLPIVVGSPDDNIILTLRPGTIWTLPVHVEHQLVRINAQASGAQASGAQASGTQASGKFGEEMQERRWTAVQEVRIASPRAVYNHLVMMLRQFVVSTGAPATDIWDLDNSFNVLYGMSSKVLLQDLKVARRDLNLTTIPYDESRIREMDKYLVVDATTPFLINKVGFRNSGGNSSSIGTYLQSARQGMIAVTTSARVDFAHDPGLADPAWLFVQLPFVGRLQPISRDDANDGAWLAKDPVQELITTPPSQPLSLWTLAATSRAKTTPVSVQYSLIDRSRLRSFRRLDPASIDEAWVRLFRVRETAPVRPPKELPKRASETTPSDSTVFSAQPHALRQLLDPRRVDIPPRRLPTDSLKASSADELVWTHESIAMWNAKIQDDSLKNLDDDHPFAYLPFIVCMQDAGLLDLNTQTSRHASVTVIPTPPIASDLTSMFQPVSLAVPAYSSIGFQSIPGPRVLLMSVAELLVFDASRRKIEILAEQLFHGDSATIADSAFVAWGKSLVQTMAFDSPAAVARIRELSALGNQQAVEIVHRIAEIPVESNAVELRRRTIPIRTSPDRARFAQGQYGGVKVPGNDENQTFEVAPPLVTGFQPLRMLDRPTPTDSDSATVPTTWPWGLSAVRIATKYRQRDGQDLGTVGATFKIGDETNPTVWWQACSMRIQYQLPQDRTLLPDGFRTAAIPGYLPTCPSSPLPEEKQIAIALNRRDATLPLSASILPARRRIIATGLRPGAPYAFREVLVTQAAGESKARSVSMTVPVQHRSPRPVLLPRASMNRHDIALQTWGSWFDLSQSTNNSGVVNSNPAHRTVLVSQAPTAEFICVKSDGTAEGVRIFAAPPTEQLVNASTIADDEKRKLLEELASYPSQGGIPMNWNGKIILESHWLPENANGKWTIELSLEVANGVVQYRSSGIIAQLPSFEVWEPVGVTSSDMAAKARTWRPGQLVLWKLAAHSTSASKVSGYKQTASLLHRLDDRPFGSPRMPRFLTWEDPEYNRRLTSLTARTEFQVQHNNERYRLALVADRREYNATGKIYYAVTSEPNVQPNKLADVKCKFTFFQVRPDGIPFPLQESSGATSNISVNVIPSLNDLVAISGNRALVPGDVLRIVAEVTTSEGTKPQVVDLPIVKLPVIPTPEAAYAVLRRCQGKDTCVRFAWGPEPARMDLVDPDDLQTQIVRRRAVYTTIDIMNRSVGQVKYAVQKSTVTGATHFPEINGD